MITVPPALDATRSIHPGWAAWLDGLPRLAGQLLDDWGLVPDGEPAHGETALVLPVLDDDGRRLALKIGMPDTDNAGEIPTLKAWGGRGAVHLERADPRRGAMLLERLHQRDLHTVDDLDACTIIGRFSPLLHVAASPTIPDLEPFVSRWLDDLEALGRDVPAPPRFVEHALHAGRSLLLDSPRLVVHGDLHQGNVLAADREPWLVIDPKGFAGDPCFDVAPVLWNRWDEAVASGDVGARIRDRFFVVVDAAGLDEHRCRDWVVVRAMITVAWEVGEARENRLPLTDAQRRWITRTVTVAKAMQAVDDGPGW